MYVVRGSPIVVSSEGASVVVVEDVAAEIVPGVELLWSLVSVVDANKAADAVSVVVPATVDSVASGGAAVVRRSGISFNKSMQTAADIMPDSHRPVPSGTVSGLGGAPELAHV